MISPVFWRCASTCHLFPVQSLARVTSMHVLLGPSPWLHQLRHGSLHVVRRLHCYYGRVRLLAAVHHRLRPAAFPMRAHGPIHEPVARSPGFRTRSVGTCQVLQPRGTGRVLAITRTSVLPSAGTKASASRLIFSRLNSWPMLSPADASLRASPPETHGAGPMRVANPSSSWTFTTYSSLASQRTVPGIPRRLQSVFVVFVFGTCIILQDAEFHKRQTCH